MTCRQRSKQFFRIDRGFTLVEVMVSLAIMALIVTVAFSGLSIGLDSWERGSRHIDELDDRATVERLLDRQLALASPMLFRVNEQMSSLFRGTNSRLEFISDYSLTAGHGDFRKIDYAIAGGHFLYGEKPLFDYVPTENDELPTEALSAFQNVRFRFLAVEKEGSLKWLDEWKLEMGLPVAVQVQLNADSLIIPLVNR